MSDTSTEEVYVPASGNRKAYTTTRNYTHPNASVLCDVPGCNKRYISRRGLWKHMSKKHPDVLEYQKTHRVRQGRLGHGSSSIQHESFECPCGDIFLSLADLRKHKMEEHTNEDLRNFQQKAAKTKQPVKRKPGPSSRVGYTPIKRPAPAPQRIAYSPQEIHVTDDNSATVIHPEPDIGDIELENGQMATADGKIFFVHPTEGVCVVRRVDLDEPYLAVVTLRHAVVGNMGDQRHNELDFSEFTRLGFKVEYVFDESSNSILTERNTTVESTENLNITSPVQHEEEVFANEPEVQESAAEAASAVKTIATPRKWPLFQRVPHTRVTAPPQHSQKFNCTQCGFGANFKKSLDMHIAKMHPSISKELPFFCNLCKQRFQFKIAFEQHYKSCCQVNRVARAPPTPIQQSATVCNYCNMRFASEERCHLHIEQEHGDLMEQEEEEDGSSYSPESSPGTRTWTPG